MVATSIESLPNGRIRLTRRVSFDGTAQQIEGLYVGRPPLYVWQEGPEKAPNLQMWLAEDCLVFLDARREQCRVRLGGSPADYGREFVSIVQGPGSALLDEGPGRVRQRAVKAGVRYRHRDPDAYVRSATFDPDNLPVDVTTADLRTTWKRQDLPDRAAAVAAMPAMPDFRSWRLEVYEQERVHDSRTFEAAGHPRPDTAFAYRSGAMPRPQLHAIWGDGPERIRMSMGVPPARGHLPREAVRVTGETPDRPVIMASPTGADAVASRMAWLTQAQPDTIWPTLAAARERPEPLDTWKAEVFDRVLAKVGPDRLRSG